MYCRQFYIKIAMHYTCISPYTARKNSWLFPKGRITTGSILYCCLRISVMSVSCCRLLMLLFLIVNVDRYMTIYMYYNILCVHIIEYSTLCWNPCGKTNISQAIMLGTLIIQSHLPTCWHLCNNCKNVSISSHDTDTGMTLTPSYKMIDNKVI